MTTPRQRPQVIRVGQAFQGTISAEVTFDSHEAIDAWLAERLRVIDLDCNWRTTSEPSNLSSCWRFIDPSLVFACQIEAGRRYRERIDAIEAFCEGQRNDARRYAAGAHARLDQRLAEERSRLVRGASRTNVSDAPVLVRPTYDPRGPLNLPTTPMSSALSRVGQAPSESMIPVGTQFQCMNPYGCVLYNWVGQDDRWQIVGQVPYTSIVEAGPPLLVPPTNVAGGWMLVRANVNLPSYGPRVVDGWVLQNQMQLVRVVATPGAVPNPRTRVSERIDVLQRGPYIPTEVIR